MINMEIELSTLIAAIALIISILSLRENKKNLQDQKYSEAITNLGKKIMRYSSALKNASTRSVCSCFYVEFAKPAKKTASLMNSKGNLKKC